MLFTEHILKSKLQHRSIQDLLIDRPSRFAPIGELS